MKGRQNEDLVGRIERQIRSWAHLWICRVGSVHDV